MKTVKLVTLNFLVLIVFSFNINQANACTGVRLTATDGSVVYGRSMEWGSFDLNSRVAIIPRGHAFTGLTPDGNNGMKWKGKYAVVGLDMLYKDYIADGMNEEGLAAGLFYHPGFASYMEYKPSMAEETISAVNIVNFILSRFASVEEVRAGMKTVQVVPVIEEALGIPVNAHWIVTDTTGISIVIEFTDGQLKIHENPLGVITNSPNYDWHMTNLRNYVNLSAVAIPDKKIEDLDFTPIGAGSGMIGLPGDFTPPSRFVRAVAWTQTARPTAKSEETVYEIFRILDNFNLPLGSAEGSDNAANLEGMRSSTIWTAAWDLTERVLYYHTQHNRRIRKLDLKKIDFSKQAQEIVHIPLDDKKEQDIKEISFRK